MGASSHSTVENNPTPDPAAAGIWERLDHLLDTESPAPAAKLVQFPSPHSESRERPTAPLPHPVDLPSLDATLEALLKIIAPDHSRGETLEALQQVVTVLNSEEGAALATQADIQRLTNLHEDLRGQVTALQTPAPPMAEPSPSDPTANPTNVPTPPETSSSPREEPEANPALTMASAVPPAEPLLLTIDIDTDDIDTDTPVISSPEPPTDADPEPPQRDLDPPRRRFALNRRQGIGVAVIALILGALVAYSPWSRPQRQLAAQLESALAADPHLSLYRILPQVQGRRVILRGTVPHRELHQEIRTLIQELAPNYQLEDQLIVVDGPVIATVNQLAATFNTLPGTMLTAQFHGGQVVITGTTTTVETEAMIVRRFGEIPGVMAVENLLQVQPLSLPTRFYFRQNQATVEPVDIQAKVIPVKNFLEKYPHLRVEIRGYSHGSEWGGDFLALQRAEAVQILLENHGIDRRRLTVVRTGGLPANVAPDQDRWLHRTVAFTVLSDRPSGQH